MLGWFWIDFPVLFPNALFLVCSFKNVAASLQAQDWRKPSDRLSPVLVGIMKYNLLQQFFCFYLRNSQVFCLHCTEGGLIPALSIALEKQWDLKGEKKPAIAQVV